GRRQGREMVRLVIREFVTHHGHIHGLLTSVDPGYPNDRRQAVYRRALQRLRRQLRLLSANRLERLSDVSLEIAVVRTSSQLGLTALAVNRHRARSIDHVETARGRKSQAQVR